MSDAPRYNPWRELRAAGDEIVFKQVELPSGVAWWVPRRRVILMEPKLTQVRRRCALAHELAHRHLGHSGQCKYADSKRQASRVERAADHWAARRLIEVEDLADVLSWTDDRDEAADELWVTRHLLEVRLEHLHPGEWAKVRQRLLRRDGHDEEDHGRRRGGDGPAGLGVHRG